CELELRARRIVCCAFMNVATRSSAVRSVCWRAWLVGRRFGTETERSAALGVKLPRCFQVDALERERSFRAVVGDVVEFVPLHPIIRDAVHGAVGQLQQGVFWRAGYGIVRSRTARIL